MWQDLIPSDFQDPLYKSQNSDPRYPHLLNTQGDLMTPTPPADASYQRISRMTLALLADTGW